MEVALKDKPAIPFHIPPGLRMVRVRGSDGLPAQPGDEGVILEAFKAGTVPIAVSPVLDGSEKAPVATGPVLDGNEKLTAKRVAPRLLPVVALEGFGGLY